MGMPPPAGPSIERVLGPRQRRRRQEPGRDVATTVGPHRDDLVEASAHRVSGGDAKQLLGRLVEHRDVPIGVDRDQRLRHAGDDRLDAVAQARLIVGRPLEVAGHRLEGVGHRVEGGAEHTDLVVALHVGPHGEIAGLDVARPRG